MSEDGRVAMTVRRSSGISPGPRFNRAERGLTSASEATGRVRGAGRKRKGRPQGGQGQNGRHTDYPPKENPAVAGLFEKRFLNLYPTIHIQLTLGRSGCHKDATPP